MCYPKTFNIILLEVYFFKSRKLFTAYSRCTFQVTCHHPYMVNGDSVLNRCGSLSYFSTLIFFNYVMVSKFNRLALKHTVCLVVSFNWQLLYLFLKIALLKLKPFFPLFPYAYSVSLGILIRIYIIPLCAVSLQILSNPSEPPSSPLIYIQCFGKQQTIQGNSTMPAD